MSGRKARNPLIVILLVGLLLVLSGGTLFRLGTINPGFEGAKCYFYGSYFPSSSWSAYTGTDILHKYQDAEPYLIKYSGSEGAATRTRTLYWSSLATPNDAGMGFEDRLHYALGGGDQVNCKPDLGIHVESNIQLQDINRQGDPLGWNASDPSSGKRIEYWSKTAVKEETADKILYHYTLTKESFIVSPAEFWVGFYLVPSQSNTGGTGSGWREGEWQGIVVWFMLDFTTWDNAYKDPWLDDPKVNVFDSPHGGIVLNQQRTSDYRGGFPIAGWIQGWEKAGWTSMPEYQESPQWYETHGKESKTYTISELADLKDKLMAKCRFSPSLVGQFLSLYNEPSVSFDYKVTADNTDYSADALASNVKTPDSRMRKTMYFPINILNFGTLADGDWWNGWRVFYPSCYFRMRMLYGVYGSFTYLWTEELAKEPTVNYPEEPERHGTTVISTIGAGAWFEGIGAWLTNPWTLFWLFSLGTIIMIVLLIIFAPGVLTAIAGLVLSRRKGGR